MKFKGRIELTPKSAKHLLVDVKKQYEIDILSKARVISNNNYVLISVPELGIDGEIQVNEINFFTQELEIKGWISVNPEAYLCQVRLILQ
jgi:predicted transcriptional regulator